MFWENIWEIHTNQKLSAKSLAVLVGSVRRYERWKRTRYNFLINDSVGDASTFYGSLGLRRNDRRDFFSPFQELESECLSRKCELWDCGGEIWVGFCMFLSWGFLLFFGIWGARWGWCFGVSFVLFVLLVLVCLFVCFCLRFGFLFW